MLFTPPLAVGHTNLQYTDTELNSGSNGLFRASFDEAHDEMPHLSALFHQAWVLLSIFEGKCPADYEIDVKVHMLMPNQYPCIPNWHCDNVPRGVSGTDYLEAERLNARGEPPMYLWVSGTPCTKFLAEPLELPVPKSHADLGTMIRTLDEEPHSNRKVTQLIKPNTFYKMGRLTPHQGTASAEHCWRVFMRLTHKSCLPARPKTQVLRRHSQVYLDSTNFGW